MLWKLLTCAFTKTLKDLLASFSRNWATIGPRRATPSDEQFRVCPARTSHVDGTSADTKSSRFIELGKVREGCSSAALGASYGFC